MDTTAAAGSAQAKVTAAAADYHSARTTLTVVLTAGVLLGAAVAA